MPNRSAVLNTRPMCEPGKAAQLTESTQVAFCLITIGRNQAHSPTGLHVSPGRAGEVYYVPQGREPSTAVPRQILWTVNQIHEGETVTIEAKPGAPRVFGSQKFTIKFPQQAVLSGPVDPRLYEGSKQRSFRWSYSVKLTGSNLPVPPLDPDIIVEEDP